MKVKYPRTPHIPCSPGATSDDKKLKSLGCFKGKRVVITEKMDGECTTLYRDGFHARSLDSRHQEYHSWLAWYHAERAHLFDKGSRVCGEYLFARHSIEYDDLRSYFMVFNTWVDDWRDSWADTVMFCDTMEMTHAPVIYEGVFDEKVVYSIIKNWDTTSHEGIVIRNAGAFKMEHFQENVAKWVRKDHVTTDKHWSKHIVRNGIG